VLSELQKVEVSVIQALAMALLGQEA